jgi:hypothetical protein
VGQSVDTAYKNQIKISPFRLFDLFNPGMEISYERMHGKRSSTQLSYTLANSIVKPYSHLRGYGFHHPVNGRETTRGHDDQC